MDRDRRRALQWLGAAGLALACERRKATAPSAAAEAPAGGPRFPEKAGDLVLLTDRPPNLEMPLHYLRHDLTPNDAFFVRWHLAGVPLGLGRQAFRLRVAGHVARPLELSLDQLERMDPVELVAVNQCSGNGRALSSPRVPGVQWTHGAMGNARWRGVRLRDLLSRAGVKAGAVEVAFRGADVAPLPTVPRFEKSLGLERAVDPDILVAYAMNGGPLPVLNGFPLRLVVPGWYSTYWIKALEQITVLPGPFGGYWMARAYRIPANPRAHEAPDLLLKETTPIAGMNVRSFLVPPAAGSVRAGRPVLVEGVAFDGGSGIRRVEVSTDGGATFTEARLDSDLGRYSWRRFRMDWTPRSPGVTTLLARATSVAGETQSAAPRWNRAGYMRNAPESLPVTIT